MNTWKSASKPAKLSWTNLEYEVEIKLSKSEAREKGVSTQKHRIIKGVSGHALPGQTLYIMGSSGAGKTSLLNIISDRITAGRGNKISGDVLIND